MPAIPSWAPEVFTLTNPFNGSLEFNYPSSTGLFLLRGAQCSFDISVRSQKDNVPQADGSILHQRFLTGTEISLAIEFWENNQQVACDSVLRAMLDELSGVLRSLLNAGDNEGRLSWTPDGALARMVDDVRLLEYPRFQANVAEPYLIVKLDSQYPYAQDLVQTLTPCSDGVPVTLNNTGSADYFPVFIVNRLNGAVAATAVNNFTITVTQGTNVVQFVYSDAFPGADPISVGGHYAEINTFANTIYLDGSGANLKAGVDELNSEYMPFPTGSFDVQIDGCDMDVLWAPAWG